MAINHQVVVWGLIGAIVLYFVSFQIGMAGDATYGKGNADGVIAGKLSSRITRW